MPKEVTSVVFSFIRPEFISQAVLVYQEAIDNYKKLKGCMGIKLFVKVDHPNEFMVISKWITINERDEYLKSEYHRKAVERLKPYRQSDPIMNNFKQITNMNNK